jgi:predicted ATP-dependent endonuclease of OLD family
MTSRPENANPNRLTRVRVQGFRTLRDASFRPGPVTALVGDPGTGKSNLLAAIRAILDPTNAPLVAEDVAGNSTGPIRITVETERQGSSTLQGHPPGGLVGDGTETPPLVYLPAALRADQLIASPLRSDPVSGSVERPVGKHPMTISNVPHMSARPRGSAEVAQTLVTAIEEWIARGTMGTVVLIEEPELFLSPQTQRYLYRQLRRFTAAGNQVIYSTHSPSFLNVSRLHELVVTDHDPETGTTLTQPEPIPADEEFRAYSEFDATRSELFLARAAILVEGQTERLALPFVFHALGYDPDQEGISIIECGGKPNIPVIARVAKAVRIPFLAVHDRDAPTGKKPNQAEQHLNQLIGQIAGKNRIELTPDFEGVAHLRGRSKHKPARAWRSFAHLEADNLPRELTRIVRQAVELARH